MTASSVDSLAALGFVVGLRHAIEADHLAAVTAIVTERRSLLSSSMVGALWGLGHTLALLIAGALVLLLRYEPSERTTHALELCVGLMLVGLGANVFRTLIRPGAIRSHQHSEVEPSSHADVWGISRPLFVGMVHGLAGSAPLLLLALTMVSSRLAAFSYIAVFGIGSMMGMAIMSMLIGLSALLSTQSARTHLALRGVAGVFSVGLGLFIVYQNSVLYLLLA